MSTATDSAIILRLNTPEEMFEVKPTDIFSDTGRTITGIDELVLELTPRRLVPGVHATISLPGDQIKPHTQAALRQAIHRYCRLRLHQIELARQAQWHDVMAAFRLGFVIFGFGILFSYYFNASHLATLTKLLLGDGFFLVIAWVGLWYPMDALVHYRRQSAKEEKVLAFIASIDFRVVTMRV